ncbi:trypsin-like peptidase domain-containing protein [Planctomycetaceae bacterium]|nr:trypsin-like peptidase domain-containing protein [Planctomycetaceae bacterium]
MEQHEDNIPPIEEMVTNVRPSVVTIRHVGRGGNDAGLGTGFVISSDGFIATNLHVIGEARPVSVELADGRAFDVTEVHATDRNADVAVIRIEAKGLQPLALAAANSLRDGQEIIAIGNPHGLERSVVVGHVSGRRVIDGTEMIQLAIPIESGNSGGPLLDRSGQVHGILTLKSQVTRNLGFAVAANHIDELMDNPNPVLLDRWLTIGQLDSTEWLTLGGGLWRQRAGRITVMGKGKGFGGRSLCLAKGSLPGVPYEVGVQVKLDDESGAAGLVFEADGEDKHYGFYPSNGRLRFTRFDGPTVFNWNVIEDVDVPEYRKDDWNHLRVRVEEDGIRCYVNDQEIVVSSDQNLRNGRPGLVSFRGTEAAFRRFSCGAEVPRLQPDDAVWAQIEKTTVGFREIDASDTTLVKSLAGAGSTAVAALQLKADSLSRQSEQLRVLASQVHHHQIVEKLLNEVAVDDEKIDMFRAALQIACLDNQEIDCEASLADIRRLSASIKAKLPVDANDADRLAMLDQVLFSELGFHGSRGDYYNRSNSYVNEVLDDREGIPITLAVVYMELAKRLGVEIHGIGFPGHFLVRFDTADGSSEWIDVFERGKRLTREDLTKRYREQTGEPLNDNYLETSTSREILSRMLNNLLSIAIQEKDAQSMLRYLDAMLAIRPDSARSHFLRMLTARQLNNVEIAKRDARWLLIQQPSGIDLAMVKRLLQALEADSE